MAESKLSRIGLLTTLLGFAVLGASLYAWAQTSPRHRLYYTEDEYKWVRANFSSAPAVETDEIWQAPATCQLPYFAKATMQAKAKVKAYNDAAPEEILAWRDRPARQSPRLLPDNLMKRKQEERERDIATKDYDAELHAKYAEWYVTVSKLQEQVRQWERRLSNVVDQKITFSEARRRSADIGIYSGNDIEQVSAKRLFEQYGLSLLGLGGFSDDQQQAIKAACVNVIPLKKIVTRTKYYTQIWRWPVDHVAAFWSGLELVLVGVFFSPIARWISTGDARTLWLDVHNVTKRLVTTTRSFLRSKFVFIALRRYRGTKKSIHS